VLSGYEFLGAGATTAAGQLGGVVGAAKRTGDVTKDAAKTAGEATKKGAKTGTETVAGKAQSKCKDGTTQIAKTARAAAAACTKHGAVAK